MIWVKGRLLLGCVALTLGACAGTSAPAPAARVLPTLAPTDTPAPPDPAPSVPTTAPTASGGMATLAPTATRSMATLAPATEALVTARAVTSTPAATPAPATVSPKPTTQSAAPKPATTPVDASTATATAVGRPALAPGATARAEIRIDAAFARSAPVLTAGRAFPVFHGNQLAAVGRTLDGSWLAVKSPEGATGWLLRLYAPVDAGLEALPVAQPPGPALVTPASFPAYLSLPAAARQRYRAAIGTGRDGRVFAVAGACNSEAYAYVRRVATALYDTSALSNLHGAVQRFAPSFSRVSMAARGGYTVQSLFDPAWVEPGICPLGEGPLACELRQTNASIVIVEMGTGDQFGWQEFEPHYREIVDYILRTGALPVLVTKADDLDHQQGGAPDGFINAVVRRVAAEKQLPLIDLHVATRGLPNFGLLDEGNFDFHLSPAGSDLHVQATLQMLNALLQ